MRSAKTFSFRVADSHGYMTVGEFEDGAPGEVFVNIAKQGSTLRGVMDAFAISISHGLQYGVPLKTYTRSFTSMSFAPAGITDDPDIRTASSLVDYLFRRLALNYLSFDDRLELGLASFDDMPPDVMQTSLLDGDEVADTIAEAELKIEAEHPDQPHKNTMQTRASDLPIPKTVTRTSGYSDDNAPMCFNCGNQTQRSGSCYVCTACGSTTGCS